MTNANVGCIYNSRYRYSNRKHYSMIKENKIDIGEYGISYRESMLLLDSIPTLALKLLTASGQIP